MTLAHRIIPTILVAGGQVVKGRQFASDRVVGTPVQTARVYAGRQVDELVVLDVMASREGRTVDAALVEAISETLFVPLAVGGGITTADQAVELCRAGADQIVLGSAAYRHPSLVEEIARRLGSQAVVVAIDVREYFACPKAVVVACGREQTELEPAAYARHLVDFGAGEILLQSVDRDGTLEGYDLEVIASVAAAAPSSPLIASGGCGTPAHMAAALRAGADAVASGAMFSFTETTPADCRAYLAAQGFSVRRVA